MGAVHEQWRWFVYWVIIGRHQSLQFRVVNSIYEPMGYSGRTSGMEFLLHCFPSSSTAAPMPVQAYQHWLQVDNDCFWCLTASAVSCGIVRPYLIIDFHSIRLPHHTMHCTTEHHLHLAELTCQTCDDYTHEKALSEWQPVACHHCIRNKRCPAAKIKVSATCI